MSSQISRRSFLKSLSLLALMPLFNERVSLVREAYGLSQSQEAPNVLIFVPDTLSAKHMSVYGYRRETTPHLARFAERATVYHACYSGGNYTTPGTSSLLTGVYPWSHRAFNVHGTLAEAYKRQNLFSAFAGGTYHRIAYTNNWTANVCLYQLREEVDLFLSPRNFSLFDRVLADRMFPDDADIAYRTERFFLRGIKLNDRKYLPGSLVFSAIDRIVNDAQKGSSMKEYASLFPRGTPRYGTSVFLLEDVIDGIEAVIGSSRKPFLGYFQPLPPHGPYNPRREFIGLFDDGWVPLPKEPHFFSEGESDERLNRLRRHYDEYIAYVDAEFGRLYDFMEQTGLLGNTYVVFTSDHGEMFERGILAHSTPTLYEPIIRVPLLISKPGQQQREDVYAPTSCVDLLPTLLWMSGQAIPDWCEGQVLPTFGGREADSERSVFAVEAKSNLQHTPLTKATVALVKDRYKLIHYFGYDGYEHEYELYDLRTDPEEMEDLYLSRRSVSADLQRELEEKLRAVNQPYLGG